MSCPAFVAQSFAVRTAAHLLHLTTKSYAHHRALGTFYEDLLDLTDKYAEVHMGESPVTRFPTVKPPEGEPVEVLTEYLAAVRDEQGETRIGEAKKNILAEIEELTLRTLYKLKTLS